MNPRQRPKKAAAPLTWAPGDPLGESPSALLGAKAVGLGASIGAVSIPPYIVLTTEWTKRGVGKGKTLAAAATEDEWNDVSARLSALVASAPYGIIVRSSIPDEPLAARGSATTDTCESELATVLETIERVFVANSSFGSLAVIVQHTIPGQSGHLSNEFRIAKLPTRWCVELQGSSFDDVSGSQAFRFSTERDTESAPAGSARSLNTQLHDVARLRVHDSSRWHFEWVFDGLRLWIVQADEEVQLPRGPEPGAVWLNRTLLPLPSPPAPFRRAEAGDAAKYCKLDAQPRFAAVGAPTTDLIVLDDPVSIRSLIAGTIPDTVRSAIEMLLDGGALVARTDIQSTAVVKELPRSNCILSLSDFERFVAEKMSKSERLSSAESTALILHRFIPARGCAFAYVRDPHEDVQIDATYGLPDGLSIYPHDSYKVAIDGKVTETTRFKSHFLDPQDDGDWVPRAADPQLGWDRSLSHAQAQEIARISRQVAANAEKPLLLMFFTGGHPEAMPLGVLPWIIDPEVPPKPSADLYLEASRGLHTIPEIRDVPDLERIGSAPRALFRPRPDNTRNGGFLKAVSRAAKTRGTALVWEGSILAHGWYQLVAGGAVIIPLGVAPDEVDAPGRIEFNKLVRDGIPTKILRAGERPLTTSVSGEALVHLLQQKLIEEALEVLGARSRDELREELADVLEIIDELLKQSALTQAEVLGAKARKFQQRGGFADGIVLRQTEPVTDSETFALNDSGHGSLAPGKLQELTDARVALHGSDGILIPRIPSHQVVGSPSRPRRIVVRGIVLEITEEAKSVVVRIRGPAGTGKVPPQDDQLGLLT